MKIYDYIFYKTWIFFRLINPDLSGFLAVMALCWLFLFNTVPIIALVVLVNRIELVEFFNKIIGAFAGIAIVSIHFAYFNRKKVKKIYTQYNNEKKSNKILGSILVVLYVVASIYVCLKIAVPMIDRLIN